MSDSRDTPALEALFQAARQVEASLVRERAQSSKLQVELEAQRVRHASELEQARQYAQKLLVRDQELCRTIANAKNQLQAHAAHGAQLQQTIARLNLAQQEQARKTEFDLTAARASSQHIKQKAQGLEDHLERLRPELSRAREELDRAQSEVLERDHRHQTLVMSYQSRDRGLLDTIQGLKDQLKRTQEELGQYKSRWQDAEKQRQDSENFGREAEQNLRRLQPVVARLKELEQAARSFEQRLLIERRQREQADLGFRTENHERERLEEALNSSREHLARTEAELSKAQSEVALLKSARLTAMRQAQAEQASPKASPFPLSQLDLETLQKLALPGYPVQDLT